MRLKNQAKYTGSGLEQVMSWPKFDPISSGPCRAELKKFSLRRASKKETLTIRGSGKKIPYQKIDTGFPPPDD